MASERLNDIIEHEIGRDPSSVWKAPRVPTNEMVKMFLATRPEPKSGPAPTADINGIQRWVNSDDVDYDLVNEILVLYPTAFPHVPSIYQSIDILERLVKAGHALSHTLGPHYNDWCRLRVRLDSSALPDAEREKVVIAIERMEKLMDGFGIEHTPEASRSPEVLSTPPVFHHQVVTASK